MKNSEKIVFLVVVVVGAFFAHALYPSIIVSPQSATADESEIMKTASSTPLLVLPQITAVDSSNNTAVPPPASTPSSASTSTSTTPQNINSDFTRVVDMPIPSFSSEAYMIGDLTTGAILSGSNTATRWPTASLTKLMTATIILDNIPTSTQITITPQMFAADPTEATLVVGDTYNVEDLLHLLLMPSSNVAAEAMADYFGRAQFMAAMNARAQAWGMKDTYFDDPDGISAANESTAQDLFTLAQHVYDDYPEILAITDTHQTTITEINTGKKVLVTSINDFAGEPGFIGGKTGHTAQAGGNLLSIFQYDGHPVIIIVLDTVDRFGDTSKLYAWFRANFT